MIYFSSDLKAIFQKIYSANHCGMVKESALPVSERVCACVRAWARAFAGEAETKGKPQAKLI
jgi:hypothetical protein